jgi:hypothetical protein
LVVPRGAANPLLFASHGRLSAFLKSMTTSSNITLSLCRIESIAFSGIKHRLGVRTS